LGETISRDTVAALQKRADALTKESRKPLFRIDPFRIVTENIDGETILPTDDAFAGVEEP